MSCILRRSCSNSNQINSMLQLLQRSNLVKPQTCSYHLLRNQNGSSKERFHQSKHSTLPGLLCHNPWIKLSSAGVATSFPPISTGPPKAIDLSSFVVEDDGPVPSTLHEYSQWAADYLPTAAEIEITSWMPTGGVYNILCFLHDYMPWWAAIATITIAFRILISKLVIDAQRNAESMRPISEKMTALRERLIYAKQTRNNREIEDVMSEMVILNHEMMPVMMKNFRGSLLQAPFFMSNFFVLKNMANFEVPSMKTEGLFWFTNLTLTDPWIALPAITALTLHLVVRLGTEFSLASMPEIQKKFMMYGLPALTFCFTLNFPTALCFYWTVNNLFSLFQTYLLTRDPIRKMVNLPTKAEMQKKQEERKIKQAEIESKDK